MKNQDLLEEKYSHITLIKSRINLGFGKGVNLGVQNANKEYAEMTLGTMKEVARTLVNQK